MGDIEEGTLYYLTFITIYSLGLIMMGSATGSGFLTIGLTTSSTTGSTFLVAKGLLAVFVSCFAGTTGSGLSAGILGRGFFLKKSSSESLSSKTFFLLAAGFLAAGGGLALVYFFLNNSSPY